MRDAQVSRPLSRGGIMKRIKQLAVGCVLLFALVPFCWAQDEGSSCEAAFVGGKPDKAAIAAIRKAAEENDADAQYRLGCLYRYGWGVEIDRSQAKGWLGHAAGQRHKLARYEFFDLQAWDEVQDKEEKKKRIVELRKQGEAGDVDVQFKLGMIYRDGLGVPRNYTESIKWLGMAARQGLSDAQFRLGMMYYRARGVERDYVKARFWLDKAVAQQHDQALLVVGRMYEMGEDVEKDMTKAMDFYRRSAWRGNGKAKERLERMERGK